VNIADLNEATLLLQKALGSVVSVKPSDLEVVSYDGLKIAGSPNARIRIENAKQVGEVLKIANQFSIPVTTKGAGSSLTGGATPIHGGWVLDLSALNQMEIDQENRIAQCGPGVIVAHFQEEAEKLGLFYPPDPSSKKFCTIGGNIACNAGGLRCLKYGVTRDYVLSLGGYLANGEFVRWGRSTRKFATGYNLRDLWIGSEGTLGVVTEITVKLIQKPLRRKTFLGAFIDNESALAAPHKLSKLNLQPSILEYMDKWTINCLQDYLDAEVFEGVSPSPMLLIELDGLGDEVDRASRILTKWLEENSLAFRVADDEADAEKLWQVRRQGSSAMKKLASTKLNEDVVVPLSQQIKLVKFVENLRQQFDLKIGVFGHCGDGNLHVNFMYDEENPEETNRAVQALSQLMSQVISLGGAISGEHGVGLAKTPFVREQFNGAEWKVMKSIKNALDPKGILNPGKIFDVFKPWEEPKLKVDLHWEK
jgi:glycolate oxidase